MGEAKEYIMESFNILYLANSGEIFGGGQVSLLGLMKGLNQGRFHPLAVCPAEGSLVDELNKVGIETQIIRMETLRNLNIFSWMRTIHRLIRLIKGRKIDLIHSNGSRATIYGGIAARLTKTPLIWHVRIVESEGLYDRFLVSLSSRIVVISQAVKGRFAWLRGEDKLRLIYNGVDLAVFHPDIDPSKVKEEFALGEEGALVGVVGALTPWKGQEYFYIDIGIFYLVFFTNIQI